MIEVVAPLDLDDRLGSRVGDRASVRRLDRGRCRACAGRRPLGRSARAARSGRHRAFGDRPSVWRSRPARRRGDGVRSASTAPGFSLAMAASVPWLDEAFEEGERGLAYGVQNLLYAGGYAIGPLLGGLLLDGAGADLAAGSRPPRWRWAPSGSWSRAVRARVKTLWTGVVIRDADHAPDACSRPGAAQAPRPAAPRTAPPSRPEGRPTRSRPARSWGSSSGMSTLAATHAALAAITATDSGWAVVRRARRASAKMIRKAPTARRKPTGTPKRSPSGPPAQVGDSVVAVTTRVDLEGSVSRWSAGRAVSRADLVSVGGHVSGPSGGERRGGPNAAAAAART